MAKSNKWAKFEVESTNGTQVESRHWRFTMYDADGNIIDKGMSEALQKELEQLDAKYADVLAAIVRK